MTLYKEIAQENRTSLVSKLVSGTARYAVPVACGIIASQVDTEYFNHLAYIGVMIPTLEGTINESLSHVKTYGYSAFNNDGSKEENTFAIKLLYFDTFVGGMLCGAFRGGILTAVGYNLAELIS